MRLNWTSLLTALSSTAVTGTIAALYGPKAGAVVGALAFVVQSQLHPIARTAADVRATDPPAPPSDGEKVQATLGSAEPAP